MKVIKYFIFICCLNVFSQETLPIYQDYLSDNVYLLHPAAAGVGSCGKIRVTARTQWLGVDNAPNLQTVSFHTKMGSDAKTALGIILFNDKNGFHSQQGIQGTYAYHLSLDQTNKFEQLSFGLSFSGIANQLDQTTFDPGDLADPLVSQTVESSFYLNADVGVGYHLKGLSSYFTIKNVFLTGDSDTEQLNLRNYVLGVGYFYGDKEKYQYEPSLMFQYKDQTGESIVDANFKLYKNLRKSQIWAALSYRRSIGGNSFEPLQFISPIIGYNFNKMMVSYTYSKQLGDIVLSEGGFHQISLGLDLLCGESRLSACPNINGALF